MNVSMGLKTRLRLTKIAAVLTSLGQAELATDCEELAGAGIGMVLAKDERAYQIARESAAYDAIVGIIANPNLAVNLGADVSVADHYPIPKPQKYGLRGLICESEDVLTEAIKCDDVDFLLVASDLIPSAARQAPVHQISAKPWFAYLDNPNQVLDDNAKRVFFNYRPKDWTTGYLKMLWPKVSKNWGQGMHSYTFRAFGCDPC